MRTVAVVLVAVALAACGGDTATDTAPNTALAPADSVRAGVQDNSATEMGEMVEIDGARATVTKLITGGDESGPWLATSVRVEASEATAVVPVFAISCGGDPQRGGGTVGSTIDMYGEVPAGSFDEGELLLNLPGDGRYGEPVPACATPAFVVVSSASSIVSTDAVEFTFRISDELVAELNAVAETYNATLG